MYYTLAAIIGYLVGSIPFAYILLRKTRSLDITREGTGNVGAMNAYEVTNSKVLGMLILLLDMLKGLLSAYICILLFPINFIYPAIALLFAMLSHCYNPWLDFKGGRGLATAAGGALLIFPYLLVIWVLLWVISYLFKKDIIFSNIFANILSLLVVLNTNNIALKYSYPRPDAGSTLIMFSISALILIMIKHIDPLKELINNKIFVRK